MAAVSSTPAVELQPFAEAAPTPSRDQKETPCAVAAAVPTVVANTVACRVERRVAAPPRLPRGYSEGDGRGTAAAATWILRGDESRRRRGCHVDIPRVWHGSVRGVGLRMVSRSRRCSLLHEDAARISTWHPAAGPRPALDDSTATRRRPPLGISTWHPAAGPRPTLDDGTVTFQTSPTDPR